MVGHGAFMRWAASALAAGFALLAQPSLAQVRDEARARATVLEPSILINDRDMNFGKVTPRGTNETVVLTAGPSSACTATGGLVHTGTCHAARFTGRASVLILRVELVSPSTITLNGPGGATMTVNNFTIRAGNSLTDLIAGNWQFLNFGDPSYEFFLGGTLNVGANQAPGVYKGTVVISMNYN